MYLHKIKKISILNIIIFLLPMMMYLGSFNISLADIFLPIAVLYILVDMKYKKIYSIDTSITS